MDCSDIDRIDAARDQLRKVVNDREMRDCTSILVYANKQDMKGAVKAIQLHEMLGLHRLTEHSVKVQPSCAKSGDGLKSGLDWLMENVINDEKLARKRRYEKMPEQELKSSGWAPQPVLQH